MSKRNDVVFFLILRISYQQWKIIGKTLKISGSGLQISLGVWRSFLANSFRLSLRMGISSDMGIEEQMIVVMGCESSEGFHPFI